MLFSAGVPRTPFFPAARLTLGQYLQQSFGHFKRINKHRGHGAEQRCLGIAKKHDSPRPLLLRPCAIQLLSRYHHLLLWALLFLVLGSGINNVRTHWLVPLLFLCLCGYFL